MFLENFDYLAFDSIYLSDFRSYSINAYQSTKDSLVPVFVIQNFLLPIIIQYHKKVIINFFISFTSEGLFVIFFFYAHMKQKP